MAENAPDSGLQRQLGLSSATMLVVAAMVGSGIFTTSGLVLREVGSVAALLLCWAAGGGYALTGALCYAELGAMFPEAGGEYAFLRHGFGRATAFLAGWVSLVVGFSAPIASGALAFSCYAPQVLPVELQGLWPHRLAALGVIAVLACVHAVSLRAGSRMQNCLTATVLTVLCCFILFGLASSRGSFSHFTAAPQVFAGPGRFAVGLIFVLYAYGGWNAAVYLGAEISRPGRTIPRALLTGTLAVTLLYLLFNVTCLYGLAPDLMRGQIEVGALAARALFGAGTGRVFSGLVALCLLSVVSAMMFQGPRVYYAMARDGSFFRVLGRVSPVRRTPVPAVLLQAGVSALLLLSASFEALLIYIGFTLSIFSALTAAGMMVLRRTRPGMARPYRTPWYPVTPLVFIGLNLWLVVFSLLQSPAAGLWGLLTIGAGAVVYTLFRHSAGCSGGGAD